MVQDVIMLGFNGNATDAVEAIEDINADGRRYNFLGFLATRPDRVGQEVDGYPVLSTLADVHRPEFRSCSFADGLASYSSYWLKKQQIAALELPLDRFVTIVHPSAYVSRRATLGQGVIILQHCTVNNGARIGNHVMILPNAAIEHDGEIGDYTSICGGVVTAGFVRIGESCYLGTNVAIRDGARIGPETLIGMGAAVVGDVGPRVIAVGVPARVRWTLDEWIERRRQKSAVDARAH